METLMYMAGILFGTFGPAVILMALNAIPSSKGE